MTQVVELELVEEGTRRSRAERRWRAALAATATRRPDVLTLPLPAAVSYELVVAGA